MPKERPSPHAFGPILLAAVFLSSSTSTALADDTADPWLPKGRTVWGWSGAFGLADGNRAGQSGSFSIVMNRNVTNAVGPGWLRGRMGVVVEIVPLFLLSQESTAHASGFNLLGRHYLDRGGSLRPFITLGAGMLVSAQEIPDRVANLNFTPQAGIGFMFSDESRRLYTLEIRLHHLSNGGRVEPNPGINSVAFQFGILFNGRRDTTP
jgi:hypothetical protein